MSTFNIVATIVFGCVGIAFVTYTIVSLVREVKNKKKQEDKLEYEKKNEEIKWF